MRIFLIILSTLVLNSCTEVDDRILPLVGIYHAHVMGVAGPFDLLISANKNNEIQIEAPFDGENWDIVLAKIGNRDDAKKTISSSKQNLSDGEIKLNGFYIDNTLQLDYTIFYPNEKVKLKIIAQKL